MKEYKLYLSNCKAYSTNPKTVTLPKTKIKVKKCSLFHKMLKYKQVKFPNKIPSSTEMAFKHIKVDNKTQRTTHEACMHMYPQKTMNSINGSLRGYRFKLSV